MNKLTIPAILVATVMVAGIFAFMPVQQASTVHTTGATTLGANSITNAIIADNAIGATEIADVAIDAATFAAGAIDAAALADAVEPLNNIVATASAGMATTPLDATCGGAGDAFLAHYVVEGATTNTLAIDFDGGGADITLNFLALESLTQSGTIGAAAGGTISFTGNADTVVGIVTVQCTGNGVPAVT